jgi:hypothetical protein
MQDATKQCTTSSAASCWCNLAADAFINREVHATARPEGCSTCCFTAAAAPPASL